MRPARAPRARTSGTVPRPAARTPAASSTENCGSSRALLRRHEEPSDAVAALDAAFGQDVSTPAGRRSDRAGPWAGLLPMVLPQAVGIGHAHLQDASVAVDVLDRQAFDLVVGGRVRAGARTDESGAVGKRPFGAVGIDARADVEGARVEGAGDVAILAVLRDQHLQEVQVRGGGRDLGRVNVAVDPERGLFRRGSGRGVGDGQHPDVAALVALADRFDRDELRVLGGVGVEDRRRTRRSGRSGRRRRKALRAFFFRLVRRARTRRESYRFVADRRARPHRLLIWCCFHCPDPADAIPFIYTVSWSFSFRASLRMLPAYAELHCLSNFSFLRGASQPEELVERAQALGYTALALTDECSLAGVVRAHLAAKAAGLKLCIGSELTLVDGTKLVLLSTDRASYGNLAQLVTRGRRQAKKGSYALSRDSSEFAEGLLALWMPGSGAGRAADAASSDGHDKSLPAALWVGATFPGRAWVVRRTLHPRRRACAPRALRRARTRDCAAAGRRRRRPHARARAARSAGHADRDPPAQADRRMRLCATTQRGATPALATTRDDLSARAARRDRGDRRPLPFFARRAALRVPRGNRAAGRNTRVAPARAHRGRAR